MRAAIARLAVAMTCGLALAGCEAPSGGGGGTVATTSAPPVEMPPPGPWDRDGFRTFEAEGRLWVFREGSKGLKEFVEKGEPAKSVTKPGVGPNGMTMRSDSLEVIFAYLSVKDGYETLVNGREIWVAKPGSGDLERFLVKGPPADAFTMAGAGPGGATVKGMDQETVVSYCCAREGFVTAVVDGRLWVFRAGSKDHEAFRKHGEPAKSVTKPGRGPGGMTIRSGDLETIEAYMKAR